ncbi:hypothetical protein J4Q44_G00246550 [Coregonus suidteri]|uniref:Uncharacterized protein n=1 Tax=Coregonus suidteri TaxID=861788 RepID=A0AAN8LFX1_9TELE
MSVPAGLQSLSVSGREMKNNNSNKSQVLFPPPTGDANANQLVLIGEEMVETPDDQASSPLPPLVAQSEAQDKLLIWAKRRAPPVGQTRNSTAAPQSQDTPDLGGLQYPRSADQQVHHQYQETSNLEVELSRGQSGQSATEEEGSKQDVRCYQGNSILSSSDGGIGGGEKDRVPPPPRRQQLVRPLCQLEPGRGRGLSEPITRRRSSPSQSPDAGRKVMDPGHHGVNGRQTQETLEVKSSMVNSSNYSHLNSQPHDQPSSSPGAPQPSQASQSAQREARSLDRRGSSAGRTSSLERRHQDQSQIRYRRANRWIPTPPLHHQAPNPSPSPSPPKPKGVRPKIITYIRKGPQLKPQASDGPYQVSSLPSRLSAYTHTHSPITHTSQKHSSSPKTHTNTHSRGVESRHTAVLSASNLLYDKYRQEMQKNRLFNSGLMGTGIRPHGHTHTVPPTHTHSGSHTHTHTHTGAHTHTHSHTAPPKLGSKAESFYGPLVDKYLPAEMGRNAGSLGREEPSGPRMATQAAQAGGSGSLLRSGIGLRPQLGLGATPGSVVVTATKNRMMVQGRRTALGFSQPVQVVSPATNQNGQDNTGERRNDYAYSVTVCDEHVT